MNLLCVCVCVCVCVYRYNDAEYLVDLITEADRLGKGEMFADAYANSSLAADAKTRVKQYAESKDAHMSEGLKKELQVSVM